MKKLNLLLVLMSAFLLVGCSSSESENEQIEDPDTGEVETPDGGTDTTPTTTYTVTIYNSNGGVSSTQSYTEGSTLNEPSEPSVDNQHMFYGWYLDSSYNTEASFPMTVTSNISLYPRIITNEEYFLEAREKTVNSNYTYEDELHVSGSGTTGITSLISFNGNRTGRVQARPEDSFSYLAHYNSSGSLLIDGDEYVMHNDGIRQDVTLNEDGELTSYSSENISQGELDESSTFAKAIFEYDDEDIEALTKVDTNEYEIETTLSTTEVITTALNFFGNPIVQMIIENLADIDSLPDIDSSFGMYVTYNNGYIDTYTYNFTFTISYIKIEFSYKLDFTSYNTGALTAPNLDGLYLTSSQLAEPTSNVRSMLNSYRNESISQHSYNLEINVEGADDEYTADVSGEATRKIDGNTTYFNNHIDLTSNFDDYELTSDNSYEIVRANIFDGSVWSKSKGLFFYGDPMESTTRNDVDNYYLLIDSDLISSSYLSAGQHLEDESTYNFVFNDSGAIKFFEFINEQVYLEEDSNSIKVLGSYDSSTLSILETQVQIVYSGSDFSEINISLEGYIDTEYNGTSLDSAEFTITYNVTKETIEDYEIPETSDDIEEL